GTLRGGAAVAERADSPRIVGRSGETPAGGGAGPAGRLGRRRIRVHRTGPALGSRRRRLPRRVVGRGRFRPPACVSPGRPRTPRAAGCPLPATPTGTFPCHATPRWSSAGSLFLGRPR